jgi:hypothetical protein
MQALSKERLGIDPEVVDSGHLPALAQPDGLTKLLLKADRAPGAPPKRATPR